MYKDHLQSCTKIREYIEDKGLPAPPRGSSEELQHSKYLQIQKYFTLALPVLLVANIISGNHRRPPHLSLHHSGQLSIMRKFKTYTLKMTTCIAAIDLY